jgi:predicted MFS family arabinose efflux permease
MPTGHRKKTTWVGRGRTGGMRARPSRTTGRAAPVCSQTWFARAAPGSPEASSVLFTASFQATISLGALAGGAVVDRSSPATAMTPGGTVAAPAVLVCWAHYARGTSWPRAAGS